ncbi:helix-turn-helix domain-containing protein [Photobacterium frigidiphilum]|uniref:winged helix-turn-helix domain-containing protein n=1 Tax=Photobacterium frigidiphilum TaxID=264736 RepID=UPI003D0ECE5E
MQIQFFCWQFNATKNTLVHNGGSSGEIKTFSLSPKEADVLSYLIDNASKLVTKDALVEHVWEEQELNEQSILNVMSKLRSIFRQFDEGELIKTIRKKGYVFEVSPEDVQYIRIELAKENPVLSESEIETAEAPQPVYQHLFSRYLWSVLFILTIIFLGIGGYYQYLSENNDYDAYEINQKNIIYTNNPDGEFVKVIFSSRGGSLTKRQYKDVIDKFSQYYHAVQTLPPKSIAYKTVYVDVFHIHKTFFASINDLNDTYIIVRIFNKDGSLADALSKIESMRGRGLLW